MSSPANINQPTAETESAKSSELVDKSKLNASSSPAVQDETESMEDMPSLDALTFDHEPCSSQYCRCSRRKHHHRDESSASGPFGCRVPSRPPLKRQLDESLSPCQGQCRHANVLSPPTFCPPGSPGSAFGATRPLGRCSNLTDLVQGTAPATTLFGNEHGARADFVSFAQLHPSGAHTTPSVSAPGTASFTGAAFQSCHERSGSVDLSDLRAVLQDASELSPPPLSTCPAHRQPATAGFSAASCTCSQQASRLDDWTVDELAGYLDDFCYIPKKMSAMAEMMYM